MSKTAVEVIHAVSAKTGKLIKMEFSSATGEFVGSTIYKTQGRVVLRDLPTDQEVLQKRGLTKP